MKRFLLLFAAVALLAGNVAFVGCSTRSSPKDYLHETKEQRDVRMKWWREARFGMFIHWGVYAVPAGEYKGQRVEGNGEWIQAYLNIPRDEYEQFAKQFNPTKFNAAEWVSLAKNAGMKYIVITSKHHDGFCLWDSKLTDWDVVDATPYGKDILAQLSLRCQNQGVRFCTYYSILDWHHPAQYIDPNAKKPHVGHARNKIHPERKQEYIDYMKGQLKEIITRYHPSVLWFDGEWVDWWTENDGKDLYNYVRSLKPDIIINNRIGKGRKGMEGLNRGPEYVGDFGTPEQQIPDTGLLGVDWESCMTMNETWGYKYFDTNWKSAKKLIRNLIDIASKGGNYLLNVGPTAEGLIPEASVQRLKKIGKWMSANGEAIYATSASPFPKPSWGRYTQKQGKLFVHVFDWQKSVVVPLAGEKAKKVYLLANPQMSLPWHAVEGGIQIQLPARAPDAIATTIVIEM